MNSCLKGEVSDNSLFAAYKTKSVDQIENLDIPAWWLCRKRLNTQIIVSLKEAQRLFPSVPLIARTTSEDCQLGMVLLLILVIVFSSVLLSVGSCFNVCFYR